MNCFRCKQQAVIYQQYSGRHLCPDHLAADIESRAKRTVRQNHWLKTGSRIGVASGLRHSDALHHFLTRLTGKRDDIRLVSLTLPNVPAGRNAIISAFSAAAEAEGATCLALPDSAGDTAAAVLSAILRGDTGSLLSKPEPGTLPLMMPLREIPDQELDRYVDYQDSGERKGTDRSCIYRPEPFDQEIRVLLHEYTERHPSAPHALRKYRDILSSL